MEVHESATLLEVSNLTRVQRWKCVATNFGLPLEVANLTRVQRGALSIIKQKKPLEASDLTRVQRNCSQ